jgi:hypothetical protein
VEFGKAARRSEFQTPRGDPAPRKTFNSTAMKTLEQILLGPEEIQTSSVPSLCALAGLAGFVFILILIL